MQTKAGEGREGGAKYMGPGLIRGPRKLGKTSGEVMGATVKRVGARDV